MTPAPSADEPPADKLADKLADDAHPDAQAARARHQRVRDVFVAAGELDGTEREAFLARTCGDDAELRREVADLLGHESASTGFLEQGALGPDFSLHDVPAPTPPAVPARIGPYLVERVLAEGGMGVVYVARQESPRRTVALKVVRPGLVNATALRRLEQEAQVLGMLQHPGIAQIHEAGSADIGLGPQPWFAMEFVDGRDLLTAARDARLDTRRRVALLASICDAVQHAHIKGVVHRDLKPDNILVTGEGQPKIVDFGIARATDPEARLATLRTDAGQLLGTLPYMSPEQVRGELDVDTRTDVYALGVVGFELLTGKRPVDVSGLSIPEAARRVCETPAPPLGRHDTELRGDLETIVSKALEKSRRRRYDSAAELAADLRRWLEHQPVTARPPSAFYLLSRFTRRNRAAALVSAVGLLALLVALAFVIDYALERDALLEDKSALVLDLQKESELNASMSALAFDMLRAAAPSADGSRPELASLVERSAVLIDRHVTTDFDEAAVTHYFAQQCRDAGFEAVASVFLSRAFAIREQVIGPEAPETLATGVQLAGLLFDQGRDAPGWALLERATAPGAAPEPEDVDAVSLAATLAWVRNPGPPDTAAARRAMLDVLRTRTEQRFGKNPLLSALAAVHAEVGANAPADRAEAIGATGAIDTSDARWATTTAVLEERLGPRHLATLEAREARAAALLPRHPELAEAELRAALELRREALGAHHATVLDLRHRHARCLHRLGQVTRAESELHGIVDEAERLLPVLSPERELYRTSWARSLADAERMPDAEWQLLRAWDDARACTRGLGLEASPPASALALVALYDRWGRPEQAAMVLEELGLTLDDEQRAALAAHLGVGRPVDPWRPVAAPARRD